MEKKVTKQTTSIGRANSKNIGHARNHSNSQSKNIKKSLSPNPRDISPRVVISSLNKEKEKEKEHHYYFGKSLLNSSLEAVPSESLPYLKVNVIGLFFTGSWCPPCEQFAAELATFYAEINSKEKVFEVIQVTNERSEKDFCNGVVESRGWLYVPFNDHIIPSLVNEFNIQYLPSLIVINRDKYVLSDAGRKDLFENPGTKAFEKWHKAYRIHKQSLETQNI